QLLLSIHHSVFFMPTATTEAYTLSLHDALPIYRPGERPPARRRPDRGQPLPRRGGLRPAPAPARRRTRGPAVTARHPLASVVLRSEEHTSELQSQSNLVCRLLLEKKKQTPPSTT